MKGGKPDGELLPHYWENVLDEATFQRVQRAIRQRTNRPGPRGPRVENLFPGLLYDARTRDRMHVKKQHRGITGKRRKGQYLIPAGSHNCRAQCHLLPLPDRLRAGRPGPPEGDRHAGAAGRRAGQRVRGPDREEAIARAGAWGLRRASRGPEGREQEPGQDHCQSGARQLATVKEHLADALQREACPKSVAWAEVKSLLQLAQDPAARSRLPQVLKEVIQEIWILIVRIGSHALATVQIHFDGGAVRNYLIHYWTAGNKRPGGYQVLSAVNPAGIGPERPPLDLPGPEDAAVLEAFLRTLEPADLKAIRARFRKPESEKQLRQPPAE